MNRFAAIAAALALALALAGCGGQQAQPSQAPQPSQATQAPQAAAPSSAADDLDRQLVGEYVGSAEVTALRNLCASSLEGVPEMVVAGEQDAILDRFFALSDAIDAMDAVVVPVACEDWHTSLMQLARCEAVALASYGEAAGNPPNAGELLDEANSYAGMATGYAAELEQATADLTAWVMQ